MSHAEERDFFGLEKDPECKYRDALEPLPVCGDPVEETLFDSPPAWMRIEDQGPTNTCAANSGTSVLEKLAYMKSGVPVQLCRNYLYARGKQIANISGDNGCTLYGIQQAMKHHGCPPEEMWPFTKRYQPNIPPGLDEAAAQYRATKFLDTESGYKAFRAVIGQNIGAVEFACSWPVAFDSGYVVEEYDERGRGGHAIAALFLSSKLDAKGQPYIWVANSHGETAQRNGWMLWSPTAIQQVCEEDEWGCFGVTDMNTPAPRRVDWVKESPFR